MQIPENGMQANSNRSNIYCSLEQLKEQFLLLYKPGSNLNNLEWNILMCDRTEMFVSWQWVALTTVAYCGISEIKWQLIIQTDTKFS